MLIITSGRMVALRTATKFHQIIGYIFLSSYCFYNVQLDRINIESFNSVFIKINNWKFFKIKIYVGLEKKRREINS